MLVSSLERIESLVDCEGNVHAQFVATGKA